MPRLDGPDQDPRLCYDTCRWIPADVLHAGDGDGDGDEEGREPSSAQPIDLSVRIVNPIVTLVSRFVSSGWYGC